METQTSHAPADTLTTGAPLRIGTVALDNPTIFAPLAGITNLPMRLLAKSAGCALVYSEMISANGLVYGAEKTHKMLNSVPAEKPLAVQLFGSDPALLARSAAIVEASGAAIVDINFGCSVKKILKSSSGVALMRDVRHAETLLKAVRAAVKIPLTIKIRTGWEPSGDQAVAIAQAAEACGVDAIAVHPRTARQAFAGHAHWPLIGRIKSILTIPVIGNGDITCADDAHRMMRETGCDAIMIGRAAIGNPFIFSQVRDRLAGLPTREVTTAERFQILYDYIDATCDYLGEKTACFMLRSKLGWFVKGLPQASQFRKTIHKIASRNEARALVAQYQDAVMEAGN